ncbi:MAG: SDR family oxidoreductase [Myxococcota bacterium]
MREDDTYAELPDLVDGGYAHGPVDDYYAPQYDYAGKVAVVTGASQGIGRHVAIALARSGATVVVASRSKGGPETVKMIAEDKKAKAAAGSAQFIRCDVSRESEVKETISEIVERFGALHLAVNNAGFSGKNGPIEEQTETNYRNVFNTNVLGTLFCLKYQIKAMRRNDAPAVRRKQAEPDKHLGASTERQGYGRIVNIGSGAASVAFPNAGIYVASKHAMLGLTRNAAIELAADTDIRVNMVAPGAVRTYNYELFSEGRDEIKRMMIGNHPTKLILMPEDCVAPVLFMLSEGAFFSVGSTLMAEGGYLTV